MTEKYNAYMYLTPKDLNDIEDKVEELTNLVSQKIYNSEKSHLRNIQIGDNLNGKTLVFTFPRDLYLEILNNDTTILTTDKASISSVDNSHDDIIRTDIHVTYRNENVAYIYDYTDNGSNKYHNPTSVYFRMKLMNDFGTILTLDNNFYEYIYIYDDESVIPEYNKKTWYINEIPYVQAIDNIEHSIEILSNYLYKPKGWIECRKWDIYSERTYSYDINIGTVPQGFSYNDINRWIHNLNLIENSDMDNVTIWNTNKSQYYWNEGE